MIGWIFKIGLLVFICNLFPEKYQTGVLLLVIAGWIFVKVRDFLDSD